MPVVKRHSFLKRPPALPRAGFAEHYEHVHGPLAAAQPGFRRFACRYTQNHVEGSFRADAEALFEGITMTFQVPRADYRQGFFQHADYANVRPDEERLFDLFATVSLLGEEHIVFGQETARGGAKAILVETGDGREGRRGELSDIAAFGNVLMCARNDLDRGSASALGAGAASFPFALLWELWFAGSDDRRQPVPIPFHRSALRRGRPPPPHLPRARGRHLLQRGPGRGGRSDPMSLPVRTSDRERRRREPVP
jgi:hypothetical protein